MKTFILKIFVTVVFFLFTGMEAFAEPTISSYANSFIHGQSVQINGASFGVKSPATPKRFEDFEETNSLRTGDTSWNGPNWWGSGIWYNRVSDSTQVSGREGNYCGKTYDMGVYRVGGPGGAGFVIPSDSKSIYIFRKEWYNYQPTGQGYNHKVLRFWDPTHKYDYCVNLGFGIAAMEGMPVDTRFIYSPTVPVNQWNTTEHFLVHNDSVGTYTGRIGSWYNNQANTAILKAYPYIPTQYQSIDTYYTNSADKPARLTDIFHEHMADNDPKPPVGSYVWVDDLYIDNTLARVMIGDQPTYDSSTDREIQIPTAWSDTSITINVNQGAFKDGDTAYLFVVDENGSVSSGYQFTVGASDGQAAQPLPAPTLQITN